MSLHLGNLSPRVRIDELERVFKSFGRCSVRMKDRFGFVVYDVPGNAEKALRTLRGEKICGESISLSWSNRQPRSLPRTAKGGRSFNSYHGRNPARENTVNRKLGSGGRHEFKLGFKQQNADDRRLSSADVPEETTKYDQEIDKNHASEKDRNIKEDLADVGGGTKSNLLDSDRWEEQVGNLSNENDMENSLDFDRYEPYHGNGDDKRDKKEMNHIDHQGGSSAVDDSQDKTRVIKSGEPALNMPDSMKSKQTCYTCGDLGHKMHSCPRGEDAKRKKSRSSEITGRIGADRRGNDKMNDRGKGEYNLKWGYSKAQGSQQPGKDDVMVKEHKSDRNSSRSRELRQPHRGNSPGENVTNRTRTNRHWQKKRRRENGSPERQHTKKSRSSLLTPVSNYAVSKSKTQRSASRSNSRSRLGSRSLSSLSSSSTSHPTRSRKRESESRLRSTSKLKSKSRSRCRSTACLSLSASVSRSLSSSPNNGQMMGNPSVKAASIESKGVSLGLREVVKTDLGSGNSKFQSATIEVDSGSGAPFKLDEDVDNNHSQKRNDNNLAMSKDSTDETNKFAAQLEEADPTGHLSPNSLRGMKDTQNCDLFISNVSVTNMNQESEVVLTSHIVCSKSITSEEMHMAIKHYGLPQPVEREKDLPLETYFGSARLWPWEIIYYRRLRKGPISVENYTRRITQNEEFGIVDKFVRSSSGWGECEENAF